MRPNFWATSLILALACIARAQVITASSVTLSPGFVVSGTPTDLNASDNVYFTLRPGIVLSNSQSPIVMNLIYIAPNQMLSSLRAIVESRAQQVGERQTVEAFNFGTSRYDLLSQSLIGNDPPDNVFILPLSPPPVYIGPDDQVRMRISYKGVFPLMSYPWQIYIDGATLRYSP